jgi:hypothetical protein
MSPIPLQIRRHLLGGACALVLISILCVGLWPFHAPRNNVAWLRDEDGLLFSKYGSIVSVSDFEPASSDSCSIELWLQPRRASASGTILSFYWPSQQVVPFAVRQSLGDLKLEFKDSAWSARKIYVNEVFDPRKLVLVTIGSGETGTKIYLDGVLVRQFSSLRILSHGLTGRLVIASAPTTPDSWSGKLRGLAIYDRELSPTEIAQHFAYWTTHKRIGSPDGEGIRANYRFDERHGRVARSDVGAAPELAIPERFFVVAPQFLERPWDEFRPDASYWKDVAINIFGFIPLGFCLMAYFSTIARVNRAMGLAITIGFGTSLTIEVLQAFLPTRNSGMTDLITNTSGTAIGAALFAFTKISRLAQSVFTSETGNNASEPRQTAKPVV